MAKKFLVRKNPFYNPNPDPPTLPDVDPETGTWPMAAVTYNGVDSGPLIAAAAASSSVVVLAPGYHKITAGAVIPPGRTIIADGAFIEVTTNHPYQLQGATSFRGGTYRGNPTSPRTFATGTMGAAAADLQWVTLQRGVSFSSQNLSATTIKNSILYGSGEFNSAIIDDVQFIGGNFADNGDARNGDLYMRGSSQVTNCRFTECRILSNQSGLNGALFKNLVIDGKSGLVNESESFLFEDCHVVASVFDNINFLDAKICFEFYGGTTKNFTGNMIKNITATGCNVFAFLTSFGTPTISNNDFQDIMVRDFSQGFILDTPCGVNRITRAFFDDVGTTARADGMQGSMQDLPSERIVLLDNGTSASTYSGVKISNLNGGVACKRGVSTSLFTGVTVTD